MQRFTISFKTQFNGRYYRYFYNLHVLLQSSSLVLIPCKALGLKYMRGLLIIFLSELLSGMELHIFFSKVETWVGYECIWVVSTVT